MKKSHSDEFKLEVLNHAKVNGIHKAARQYKLDRKTIYNWNESFRILTIAKRICYANEFKLEVLNHAELNGVVSASKKFNVTCGSIKLWNDEFKVYDCKKSDADRFNADSKLEILKCAKKYGVLAAARYYDVDPSSVYKYGRELNVNIITRTKPTEEFILEILSYAKVHGVESASEKFNTSTGRIRQLNKRRGIIPIRKVSDVNIVVSSFKPSTLLLDKGQDGVDKLLESIRSKKA